MRTEINLAANISQLRKNADMTQDEVARYLGVTKASVSKWETGQSYPDVAFLPRLAALFNVTLDELMGFEPQLQPQDIRRECTRLKAEFAEAPYAEALDACQELARKYYACPALLTQVATVLINHVTIAPDEPLHERTANLALELCRRVRTLDADITDLRLANAMEGSLELAHGRPDRTVELLKDADAPSTGDIVLLASAHQALGDLEMARRVLQSGLFQMLTLSLNVLSQMAMMDIGNLERLRLTHNRTLAIIDAFDLDSVYANAVAVHASFASAYMMFGDVDDALDCLERYLGICKQMEFPLKLHGDEFFDELDTWLDEELVSGAATPLEETLVKARLLQSIVANPAFSGMEDDARFQRIVKELEVALR